MKSGRSERDIVLDLKSGNKDSFKLVYSKYYLRLFYFAREYVISKTDAEDIVQSVFLKLWKYKAALSDNTRLESWLYKVTRNEALSMIEHNKIVKKHRNQVEKRLLDINHRSLTALELPEDTSFDIRSIIDKSIQSLPPQCKKVFEYSRSMSYREISEEMSISVKTVESHMSKALSVLRLDLKDYLTMIFTIF